MVCLQGFTHVSHESTPPTHTHPELVMNDTSRPTRHLFKLQQVSSAAL